MTYGPPTHPRRSRPPIPTRIEVAFPEEVAWIRREDGEDSYQRHVQAGHILYLVDGRLRWLPPQGCNSNA